MSRAEDIQALAEFIAESYFPQDRIDPFDLAEHNDITYNFGHYADAFDGLLEYRDASFHIYGNADKIRDEHYPRARFTFGHELGHFYIDDHRQLLESGAASVACLTDFQSDATAEREADLFASHLLMPTQRFRSCARHLKGAAAVRKLSEMFGTSLSSTAIRYARLNVAPMIVIGWTSAARRWCWSSSQFAELTKNWALNDPSRLPADSETVRILHEATAAPASRGTTLSTWFPRIHAASYHNALMIEEVLPLGGFGVITLLYPAD